MSTQPRSPDPLQGGRVQPPIAGNEILASPTTRSSLQTQTPEHRQLSSPIEEWNDRLSDMSGRVNHRPYWTQTQQEALTPSFSYPYGSVPVANLRNLRESFVPTSPKVNRRIISNPHGSYISQRHVSPVRFSHRSPKSREVGWRTPLPYDRLPRGPFDTWTTRKLEDKIVLVDPMLVDHDRKQKTLRHHQGRVNAADEECLEVTSVTELGMETQTSTATSTQIVHEKPLTYLESFHRSRGSQAKTPMEDRIQVPWSPSFVRSAGILSDPSASIRRQLQQDLDMAGQEVMTEHPTYSILVPLPTEIGPFRYEHLTRHLPQVLVKSSTPNIKGQLPRGTNSNRCSLISKYDDREVLSAITNNERHASPMAKRSSLSPIYRPYPAVSAFQHGRQTAHSNYSRFFTNPKHAERALHLANSCPNPWKAKARNEELITLPHPTSHRDRRFAKHVKKSVNNFTTAHPGEIWRVGQSWGPDTADGVDNEPQRVAPNAYDLQTLFPELSAL